MEKRLEELQSSIDIKLQELQVYIRELSTLRSDIKQFLDVFKVEVKAYPEAKVYRLKDGRTAGVLIKHDHDLDKPLDDIIEEVSVESVSFKKSYYRDDNFTVFYKTSGYYAHKNEYSNAEFGSAVFVTRDEILEYFRDKWHQAKADYRAKKENEAAMKKLDLERQLAELNKTNLGQK